MSIMVVNYSHFVKFVNSLPTISPLNISPPHMRWGAGVVRGLMRGGRKGGPCPLAKIAQLKKGGRRSETTPPILQASFGNDTFWPFPGVKLRYY